MMRWLNAVAWLANFVGVSSGLYVLLVAIDRNHQGEYIDQATGALDYSYAVQMFVAWYVVSAVTTVTVLSVLATVLSIVLVLVRWVLRRAT
jgi:hypothetical protein